MELTYETSSDLEVNTNELSPDSMLSHFKLFFDLRTSSSLNPKRLSSFSERL